MPKIEITRTELVWPGKYDEDGNLVPPRRVSLPFQVIERVNETRATREEREEERAGHVATLFDYWRADEEQKADPGDGWRNKLIWGDNLYVMGSLQDHFAGKIDLIYIDPPFATGADFSFTARVGDQDVIKEQSLLEEKAYRDTWGKGMNSYLAMVFDRLRHMRDLLSDHGSIYVHVDYRMIHHVKALMDEVFNPSNFRNDIVWSYGGRGAKAISGQFARNHDNILLYSGSSDPVFNKVYMDAEFPVDDLPSHIRIGEDGRPFKTAPRGDYTNESIARLEKEGRIHRTRSGGIRVKYFLEMRGSKVIEKRLIGDVWDDIPDMMHSPQRERLDYPTQKPEALLERIIGASSNEGDLVADFFCGSGTALAVAERLGRRWIGCDMSRYAIHTTRKRMMEIPDCRPFEILNLGQYERQVWQGVTFGGERQPRQMLIFEYLKFILELYGAQPLAGTQHLHGKKGSAMVHVGAVDAPVTIDEINSCLAECRAMKQKELHVLGWEWEMGLANLMVDQAKAQGVRLLLLAIPREVMEQQAVDKGDIHFYELAYLEVEIKPSRKKRSFRVTLTDFVIPNDELIPPDVRAKIRKWSDYVDYWAVDWDFQNDTFVNGWTSYRTRRDRTLQLKTDPHVSLATTRRRCLR